MKSIKSVCYKGIMAAAIIFACGVGQKIEAEAATYDYVVTEAANVNATDKNSDALGIQSVMEKAIGSSKMVTIYFPAGDYYVDKAIRVYSNTHIILDANATVHRMDSMINNSLLYNVDQNGKKDVVGGYDMSHDIILEGGTWDGGNVKLATDGSDVVRFDHATNITIRNCTMKNTYDCHILELVGVKNGLVENCTFTGFTYKKGKEKNYTYAREAIQLESAWTSNEKDLTDKESAWAKGSVIDGTSCQQVTVTNNTFINMPCGVGQHRYTKSGKYRNKDIVISNNTFNCSTSYKYCKTAITCSGTNNLQVFGNVVKGPYRFSIHVIESDDVSITGNKIDGITKNGIMVDKGSITSISDNVLKNVKKHGISIGGGTVKDVVRNTLTGISQNGISVDDGKVTNISENVISNTKKHGISIASLKKTSGTIGTISKNQITNVKQNGICVDSGKVTYIKENTIKKAGKHGISIVGGAVGTGKKKTNGVLANVITNCKQNGITVSGKAKVSTVGQNQITTVKNNGISLTEKANVKWVTKNTIKKCKKHGIWNGTSTKTKITGNKGKTK